MVQEWVIIDICWIYSYVVTFTPNLSNKKKLTISKRRKMFNQLFSTDVKCSMETCVGVSSGTASLVDGIVSVERDYPPSIGSRGYKQSTGTFAESLYNRNCRCQCIQPVPVFRDDLRICVDDLQGERILWLL